MQGTFFASQLWWDTDRRANTRSSCDSVRFAWRNLCTIHRRKCRNESRISYHRISGMDYNETQTKWQEMLKIHLISRMKLDLPIYQLLSGNTSRRDGLGFEQRIVVGLRLKLGIIATVHHWLVQHRMMQRRSIEVVVHVVPSLDGWMRGTEFRAVRVAAAVRRIAVIATQRRRIRCMTRCQRWLAWRTVRVDGVNGRIRTGIGRQQCVLRSGQQRRIHWATSIRSCARFIL